MGKGLEQRKKPPFFPDMVAVEQRKKPPFCPDKVFGFIFFQRMYDNWKDSEKAERDKKLSIAGDVFCHLREQSKRKKTEDEKINIANFTIPKERLKQPTPEEAKAYEEEWSAEITKALNKTENRHDTEFLMSNEIHQYCFGNKVDKAEEQFLIAWYNVPPRLKASEYEIKKDKIKMIFYLLYKDSFLQRFYQDADVKWKEHMGDWSKEANTRQKFADMHTTKYEAECMYDFLANNLCKKTEDITIMTQKLDFFRLFSKPVYEGDYLTQMFDWNLNREFNAKEKKLISDAVIAKPNADEQWADFQDSLQAIKYKVKHKVRKEKRWATENMVWDFKKRLFDEQEIQDNSKTIDELVKTKIESQDFSLSENEKQRQARLLRKTDPQNFLKEDQPAYIKIQNNWVFQFLTSKQKKEYLQTRVPQYLEPTQQNYSSYLDSIKDYTSNHPNEQVLSVQTFACKGIMINGMQEVVLNEPNNKHSYYQTLEIEELIRERAPTMKRVFFLVFFVCDRERVRSTKEEQKLGLEAQDIDIDTVVKESVSNFTLAFMCSPREIVFFSQFVMTIVNHLKTCYDPEDDHVIFPDCFRAFEYDAVTNRYDLSKLNCNPCGKSLRLLSQANRIGPKQLIVIILNPLKKIKQTDEETKDIIAIEYVDVKLKQYPEEYVERMQHRTKKLLDFFKTELQFEDREIIYLTEDEVRTLVDFFDQSKMIKTCNQELFARLTKLAQLVFLGIDKQKEFDEQKHEKRYSNCNQLLTVFLNESQDETVKDFIINRNPEFALTIKPGPSTKGGYKTGDVKDVLLERYMDNMFETFSSMKQIHFENINRFFISDSTVAQFCARNKTFKQGSGHMDLILDLEKKKNYTMKARFDHLEKMPLKKLKVSKFSLAVPIAGGSDDVLMIEILDSNDHKNQEEIENQLSIEQRDGRYKKVRAFKVNPKDDDPTQNELSQREAIMFKIEIEDEKSGVNWFLNERDEIVHIKQFYYNPQSTDLDGTTYCEVLFAIVLRNQDRLNLCHVRFYPGKQNQKSIEQRRQEREKEIDELMIKKHQTFQANMQYWRNEWDEAEKAYEKWTKEEIEQVVKITFFTHQLVKRPTPEDPIAWRTRNEEEEDKKNYEEWKEYEPMDFQDDLVADDDKFTRDSRTEIEYFLAESFRAYSANKWYDEQQLQAAQFREYLERERDARKVLAQAIKTMMTGEERRFKNKLKESFKVNFDCDHLRYFASAGKDVNDKNKVYIYILTNRKRLNNMHSCMEIEVVLFDRDYAISKNPERALGILHRRQYLPYFIHTRFGMPSTGETRFFYKTNQENEKGLAGKSENFKKQYYLQQFFAQEPACFRQSSCDDDRLIFRAGSSSNWVYDLKMEKGYLRLYGQEAIDNKNFIGLQKSVMVRDLDFVANQMINVVTEQYEGMWMTETTIDSNTNMKETLLMRLPKIIKLPCGFKAGKNKSDAFVLAISKQHVSLVNIKSQDKKKELLLVRQRALSEHDCIAHAFITHEHQELETIGGVEERRKCKNAQDCNNSQGLHSLTLHYFERFFDASARLKACRYSTLVLNDEFLGLIKDYELMSLSEKTLLPPEIKTTSKKEEAVNKDKPNGGKNRLQPRRVNRAVHETLPG